jgi:hypothetical protein
MRIKDPPPQAGSEDNVPITRDTFTFNWKVPKRVWVRARLVGSPRRDGPQLTLSEQAERGITLLHEHPDYRTVLPADQLRDTHSYNATIALALYEQMAVFKIRHGQDYQTQLALGLEMLHASLGHPPDHDPTSEGAN